MAKSESDHITSCTISWENTEDILSAVDNENLFLFYYDSTIPVYRGDEQKNQ